MILIPEAGGQLVSLIGGTVASTLAALLTEAAAIGPDAGAGVDRLHLGRPTEVASAGIAWAWIELPDAAAPADIAAAQAILDGHPPT